MPPMPKTETDSEASRTVLDSLHIEFRSILMLLMLVTAINNNGKSILAIDPEEGRFIGALETPQPVYRLMLNALANILVRDTEVIAVTANVSLRKLEGPILHGVLSVQETGCDATSMVPTDLGLTDPVSLFNTLEPADVTFDGSISFFAALPNPDAKDKKTIPEACEKLKSNKHDYVAVDGGKSYWDHIVEDSKQTDSWSCLTIETPSPLKNHLITVSDYVTQYRDATQKERVSLLHGFTKYVIVSCSRKMCRRMDHWSSLGFISIIYNVTEHALRASCDDIVHMLKPSDRTDRALRAFFDPGKTDIFQSIIEDHPDSTVHSKSFTHLMASSQPYPLSADIFIEFHRLLIATLFGYRKVLKIFCGTYNNKKKNNGEQEIPTDEMLQSAATRLHLFVLLLRRIAYSQLLRYYLDVLPRGMTPIPHSDTIDTYRKAFGENAKSWTGSIDDDEDEELEENTIGRKSTDFPLAFKSWIRLQTCHLDALDILSSFSKGTVCTVPAIEFTLLAVKYPAKQFVGDWKQTIRELFPPQTSGSSQVSSSYNLDTADRAVDILEQTIQSYKEKDRDNQDNQETRDQTAKGIQTKEIQPDEGTTTTHHRWFERPCRILQGFSRETVYFSGNVHCEAALASLIAYRSEGLKIPAMGGVNLEYDNLSNAPITVSKLCCPVCWELLTILKEHNKSDFGALIRGRHSTLSQTELPSWLPQDVLQTMVSRFKEYLRGAVITMTEMKGKGHGHSLSIESNSGISVSSDESVQDDEHPKPLNQFTWRRIQVIGHQNPQVPPQDTSK